MSFPIILNNDHRALLQNMKLAS